MKLTITAARMAAPPAPLAAALSNVVFVDAVGPRGGAREYSVRFIPDGSVLQVVMTMPRRALYRFGDAAPLEVIRAAREACRCH